MEGKHSLYSLGTVRTFTFDFTTSAFVDKLSTVITFTSSASTIGIMLTATLITSSVSKLKLSFSHSIVEVRSFENCSN